MIKGRIRTVSRVFLLMAISPDEQQSSFIAKPCPQELNICSIN
jgi:hypothetical protein